MPSSPTCLRAPLLWWLLPFMGGITLARFYVPGGAIGPIVGLGVALGMAGLATIAAARPGRLAHALWAMSLVLAAGWAGFAYLHLRHPHWHDNPTRPPRETTVTLAVEQLYPASATARTLTGYGVITAARTTEPELVGRRVYFSLLRKLGLPPQRAGHYAVRGVIESLAADPASGGFNDYLANLGIRQKLTRGQILNLEKPPGRWASFYARTAGHFERILRHGLEHQPNATALYVGMLLGEKAVLSSEQEAAFMRSGTFHVFSVSGLHVGVIAAAIYAIFSVLRVSRRATVILTLLSLWLYVQVTGANFPALRAFIMVAFLLGGRALRQPGNSLAALTAAALATLLYDPLQLFSTGFQMSYSVVLALIVMGAPLAAGWLDRWHPFALLPRANWHWLHHGIQMVGRWVISAAAACWVAFLASQPSSIGYFGLFSPGSLPANLLIIPLSSLAIISGFLSLITGLVGLLSLSTLFNHAAVMIIIGVDHLLQLGTRLPGVYFPAQFKAAWITPTSLVLLSGVLLVCHAGRWSRRYGGYWPPVVALLLVMIFAVRWV